MWGCEAVSSDVSSCTVSSSRLVYFHVGRPRQAPLVERDEVLQSVEGAICGVVQETRVEGMLRVLCTLSHVKAPSAAHYLTLPYMHRREGQLRGGRVSDTHRTRVYRLVRPSSI